VSMDDFWSRVTVDMMDRITGPMRIRLVLQPMVAVIFAIISGLKDAKAGRPPYFWGLVTDSADRTEMIKDGWKRVGKIFIIATVLDVIFQIRVLGTVYPGEAIVVAIVLAIVPYVILRGLVNHIASRR
jgi:hypothetical protein